MTKHYKSIDILRGIAITLVILGHAIIVFPINLHDVPWCSFVFTWLSAVHMPLFFAISGFCYHTIEKPDYKNYINKKIKRLLIPYFFIGFIEIIVKQIFASFVNSAQGLGDSISSMILGGGYWFLYTLFIIFLIFPFLESMYMKIDTSL